MEQETDLAQRIALMPGRVNADAFLVHRGRFVTLEFRLDLGAAPYLVAVERGAIAALERGTHLMRSYRFKIAGSEEGWRDFWQDCPPPHRHDIFALQKAGLVTIEGDLQPLMANLLYFKDVLAAPRGSAA
jgi:hypothetical protein